MPLCDHTLATFIYVVLVLFTTRCLQSAAQQHTHGIPSLLTPSQHANTTAIHHLGVHYSFIPGCLTPQLRRKPLCGGLHLWLKAVRHYETHATTEQQASLSSHQPVTWRRSHLEGFYFFEEARQPRLWANLKLENPSLLLQHPLFMTITDDASASRSIVHPVTTYQPVDAYRPGWLQASIPTTIETTHHVSKIPNTALHNDYTLFIEDWARHVTLSHVLQSAEPWQSVSPTAPDVYTVIGQFYRIPVDQAAQYIAVHTEYHRHLGAAGTLFYFNDEYLGLFAQAHRLHVLQQQRVLHMVPWPYLNLIEGAHTFDQVEYSHLGVVFNHALLALWGRGAYVFMTDMDELLVTTYPSSVQGLLTGCFSMGDHITLEEYDTLCVDCLSDGGQGEEHAWQGTSGLQPLHKYTLRNTQKLSHKALVLPGSVFQFFVHDGKFKSAGKEVEVLDADGCAYVAHFRNLVDKRVYDVQGYVNDSRWMWVLEGAR